MSTLHDGSLPMRSALESVRGAGSTDRTIGTPSTARSARQAVLRHAAAAETSMSDMRRTSERPHTASGAASAVLSELEAHLNEAKAKQARWRDVSASSGKPWRHTAFGYKSTSAWVHTHLLSEELRELEYDASHGATAQALRDGAAVRQELGELQLRSRSVEGELQQQLAEVTHASWRCKEELAGAERTLRGKQEEASRLAAALATEEGRASMLEKQVLEVRHERDAVQQQASVATARRADVEAQLRESEREVRALREAADRSEAAFAERSEVFRARHAKEAAAATAELTQAAEERRRLEGQISEMQMALATEAAERGSEERAHADRIAALERHVLTEKHAAEQEVSARRNVEETLSSVREATQAANDISRAATVRAEVAEATLASAQRELDTVRSFGEALEAQLRQAEAEAAASIERERQMAAEHAAATRERDGAVAAEERARAATADAEARCAEAVGVRAANEETIASLRADNERLSVESATAVAARVTAELVLAAKESEITERLAYMRGDLQRLSGRRDERSEQRGRGLSVHSAHSSPSARSARSATSAFSTLQSPGLQSPTTYSPTAARVQAALLAPQSGAALLAPHAASAYAPTAASAALAAASAASAASALEGASADAFEPFGADGLAGGPPAQYSPPAQHGAYTVQHGGVLSPLSASSALSPGGGPSPPASHHSPASARARAAERVAAEARAAERMVTAERAAAERRVAAAERVAAERLSGVDLNARHGAERGGVAPPAALTIAEEAEDDDERHDEMARAAAEARIVDVRAEARAAARAARLGAGAAAALRRSELRAPPPPNLFGGPSPSLLAALPPPPRRPAERPGAPLDARHGTPPHARHGAPLDPLGEIDELIAHAAHGEAAARAEAARLRELLLEADAALSELWNAMLERCGEALVAMVPPLASPLAELAATAADASWLTLLDAVSPAAAAAPHGAPHDAQYGASHGAHHGANAEGMEASDLYHYVPDLRAGPPLGGARAPPLLRPTNLSTMRAVWSARARVAAGAAGHAMAAVRADTETAILGDELVEIELRQKVHNVRRNAVQRRLRDWAWVLLTWRRAVVSMGADGFAAGVRRAEATLAECRAELEETSARASAQATTIATFEAQNGKLAHQAATLQLEAASLLQEAEVHVAAEARKIQAAADEQVRAAEAASAEASRMREEADERLERCERDLASTRAAAEAAAAAAAERAEADGAQQHETSAGLAAAVAECRQLDGQLTAAHAALEVAASERAGAERAAADREAGLAMQLAAERRAVEREASARREMEETAASVREALGAANEVSRAAAAHAEAAKDEMAKASLAADEATAAAAEATVRERALRESLGAAEELAEIAQEHAASLDAEAESLRLTATAIVGARSQAIEREMQLDEGVAELTARVQAAEAHEAEARRGAEGLSKYVGELEQMVLAESNARAADERAFSEAQEQLLARIASLEARQTAASQAEAEVARQAAAHQLALEAAKETTAAAAEVGRTHAERASRIEAEAERLRGDAESARLQAATAKAGEEAAAEVVRKAQAEASASRLAEGAARTELRLLAATAAEADDARQATERKLALAEAAAADTRQRLEAIGAERVASRQREVEAEQSVNDLQAKLRDAERRAAGFEASIGTERGRSTHLRDEVDTMLRAVEESRQQCATAEESAAGARARERQAEQRAEDARLRLEAERAAHHDALGRLEQAGSESKALTSRLGAQLERERDGRGAAERRAMEASINLQTELQEAQRQAAQTARENEKLVLAARGAAAAYCSRVLVGRNYEAARRAFGAWLVAVRLAEASDKVYEVEERARQHLVAQARTFQSRLELLAMEE